MLQISLTKQGKVLYIANYKILKETEGDTNKQNI